MQNLDYGLGTMKTKLPIETAAEFLGLSVSQVEDLKHRMQTVRSEDNGYGRVVVDFKRRQVWKISHQIDGEPVTFRGEDST